MANCEHDWQLDDSYYHTEIYVCDKCGKTEHVYVD